MFRYITEGGKRMMKQAQDSGLYKYFQPEMGFFIIPCKEANTNTQITYAMFELLKSGKIFTRDGIVDGNAKWGLEVIPHMEDGGVVDGEYDFCIREIEVFS